MVAPGEIAEAHFGLRDYDTARDVLARAIQDAAPERWQPSRPRARSQTWHACTRSRTVMRLPPGPLAPSCACSW